MSGKLYVKNHLPLILLNLLGALALSLFLLATGNAIQTVLFILIIWILVLILCLSLMPELSEKPLKDIRMKFSRSFVTMNSMKS